MRLSGGKLPAMAVGKTLKACGNARSSCLRRRNEFLPGREQGHELLGTDWPAEMEALPLATMLALKERELFLRLYPLGDNPVPERFPHADDRADDRVVK